MLNAAFAELGRSVEIFHERNAGVTVTWVCVCMAECPEGQYGPNCVLECVCQHNSTCNRVTGTCQCEPGYYGHRCEHGASLSRTHF